MRMGDLGNAYTLSLRGIRFVARFGTSREERSRGQEIVVDVDLELPETALPKRDRRRDVVDYDQVVRCVVEEGLAKDFHLLESYVTTILGRLFAVTPASRIRVAATKTRAPTTYPIDAATVAIVREREKPTQASDVGTERSDR
jgi:dihydroneopterin aldolase